MRDKATWQPLPMAQVKIETSKLEAGDSVFAFTDEAGHYNLQATQRALWVPIFFGPATDFCIAKVTVTAPGYKPATQQYGKVGVASGTGGCGGAREYWNVVLEKEVP